LLLQMVGLTGQVGAAPADIILETINGNAAASGVTYSGSLKPNFVPQGGMVSWATQGAIQLNSASPYVQWEFNVPVAGSYNIYVAWANSAAGSLTTYRVTPEKEIDLTTAITTAVYPNVGGTISNDNMLLHPVETKLADMVPFKAGTNKIKIKAGTGALYNVRLEYASATDSIITGDAYNSVSGVGGNSAPGTLPEDGFYNSTGYLTTGNTAASYTVEIFETDTYVIKFYGSKYSSGLSAVDLYDSVDGGAETKILTAFQIGKGSTGSSDVGTSVSEILNLQAGTHTFRCDYVGTGYVKGFKIEKVAPLAVSAVKVNTAASALSNNNTISKGADTFAVQFSNEVEDVSVTDDTIGLYDGDNKLDTHKNVVDDTVYLTVKKALDATKTYTIKVNGVYDEYKSTVSGYALNVVTDADGAALGSSIDDEITAANKRFASSEDLNKRDVTVTGKILSSKGTPIEGREVSLKLAGDTVWTGLSSADGVFNAKYEIPLDAITQSYTFTVTGDGVSTEKTATLRYVTAAEEAVILGTLESADATGVQAFIENPEYQAMFEINPTEDMDVFASFAPSGVYTQLANLTVSDVNEFKTAYEKAILLETINQATQATDAKNAVKDILTSSEDCALLGINKDKADYITGANVDALVAAVANVDVRSEETTFAEELLALADLVDAVIDETLAMQYGKTAATSLAAATASAYVGQGFDVSLDITPAQSNLAEIKYIIESTNAAILEGAIVTSEYESATEIADGKLIVTITIPAAAPAALSTDFAVGKVTFSAPDSAGTATVTLVGKMSFDEGIPYLIEREIAPKTVTLTTTQNSSEGSYRPSSTPATGVSPKPTTPDKEEDNKDEEPDTTTPGTIPVDPEPVSNFKDLAGNEWAIEAIDTLFDKGIISDNAEKKFRPNDNVTREEFVKMIIEALGLVHETYETDLKDVEKGAWYYPYVATAVEKGIVLGDENGYFHVGENISRQDMAVIIIRVLTKLEHPYETKSTKFADDKEISDYAHDAMYAAKNLAIINGVGDNMCAPRGTATRAMAAKVIYEMMRTVGL